jgi:hypothetical protein
MVHGCKTIKNLLETDLRLLFRDIRTDQLVKIYWRQITIAVPSSTSVPGIHNIIKNLLVIAQNFMSMVHGWIATRTHS